MPEQAGPTRHLVLGGSGFIGRHVAALLARGGANVTVADREAPPPTPSRGDTAKIDFVKIDAKQRDWAELLAEYDVIHHYVWTTIPQSANEDPFRDLTENVGLTLWLLDNLRNIGGKRLVFTSSGGAVYGLPRNTPTPETHALHPMAAYGAGKAAAEHYIGVYRATNSVDGRIARIANPFGAGQNPGSTLGAVAAFYDRAARGETIDIWGDGSVVRDYIHIADVADALVRLADAPLNNAAPHVFNIGSGEGRSLNQVVEAIGLLLGRKPVVHYSAGRRFDVPVNVLDIARARSILNWQPRIDFEEGLARMHSDLALGAVAYSTLN